VLFARPRLDHWPRRLVSLPYRDVPEWEAHHRNDVERQVVRKKMKRIPVSAAKIIAKMYGYDQVVIYARKVGEAGGEHMTTYGANREHCKVAGDLGTKLQLMMGWKAKR